MTMTIVPAITPADIAQARTLFLEYAAESKLDLCFQSFEEELATLRQTSQLVAGHCGS